MCAFVSVELAPSGRPGYVPVEKHSWSQTGSHSSVPVPWLTGWANREPTGSARHMIACLCWKCHLMPPRCPSQTVLGYVIGICQHHSHSKGEDDYRDTGKEFFLFCFFFELLIQKHLMEQWERLLLLYNESQQSWNRRPRKINRSTALGFTTCNKACIVTRPYGMSLFSLTVPFCLTVQYFNLTHANTDTHIERRNPSTTHHTYNKAVMMR